MIYRTQEITEPHQKLYQPRSKFRKFLCKIGIHQMKIAWVIDTYLLGNNFLAVSEHYSCPCGKHEDVFWREIFPDNIQKYPCRDPKKCHASCNNFQWNPETKEWMSYVVHKEKDDKEISQT